MENEEWNAPALTLLSSIIDNTWTTLRQDGGQGREMGDISFMQILSW